MKLFDLIDADDFDRATEAKLINRRTNDRGTLAILNYSDAALYTPGAWDNPAVRQCRGLIYDPITLEIVARSWAKFFNHGQAEAGELDLDAAVEVTDKMDGSLGILYWEDGHPAIATRGSFTSDQAIHATKVLNERYAHSLRGHEDVTALFEIIYPENRIVCDYGDLDDLVLLGGVDVEDGFYREPNNVAHHIGWSGPIVETFSYGTLKEALEATPRPGAEGLCVRYLLHDAIVKLKQEDYVRLHRIVTGLSERSVWEHACENLDVTALLDELPDELHAWTVDVWERLWGEVNDLYSNAWAAHQLILAGLPEGFERREYAVEAMKHPRLRPWLFNLLDGKRPTAAILKSLKPAGDTRAKAYSEATA